MYKVNIHVTVHLPVVLLIVPPPPLLTLEAKKNKIIFFRQDSSWPAITLSLSLWLEMDRRYGAMIRTAGPSITMSLRVKAQIPFKVRYPLLRKAIMTDKNREGDGFV